MEGFNKGVASSFQKVRSGFGSKTFQKDSIMTLVPCEIWRDIVKNTNVRSLNKLAQTCSKFNELVDYERKTDIRYALAYKREYQYSSAIKYLEYLEHDDMALYHLGHMYWIFVTNPNDDVFYRDRAFDCFLKAAEHGNESAEIICLYFNINYYKNYTSIVNLKSFVNNFANGFMHVHGLSTKGTDFNLAWNYFKASAGIDSDEYAQFIIGQAYLLGTQSVPKDIVLAEYWFTQSARQGYLRAVKELGKIMIERADSLKSKLKLE